ncbi:coenzyme F420-0:L-glutamate ligase [Nocardioides mesophilus]|uniref:coenzyme F420-0:L-glutamate ligase n=1 Tax=Nocardioides mesophilus TaxID=433659 RepID=UPI001FE71369|nr:coenzyme F420-0:L-glutamate ligase [Nocardioides mesophilus]
MTDAVTVLPVTGVGEVRPGADLAQLLLDALGSDGLRDGDVLVVTSKVVSKAEGRLVHTDRTAALDAETARVVARRGPTTIVRTRHGLVMAGAGIDASNTAPGTVLLLPEDPDASARRLRATLLERTGCNVAVVVTDTAGRAWRHGQTDLAIGAAGLTVLHDHAGLHDPHGNLLVVTAPAVADEIAAAADLVKGKLARRPAAVLRGLSAWVLPAGAHGAGARVLVREEDQDMFGLGARDAVLAALGADPAARAGFGRAAPAADLLVHLAALGAPGVAAGTDVDVPLPELAPRELGRWEARVHAAVFALGWSVVPSHDPTTVLRLRPPTP